MGDFAAGKILDPISVLLQLIEQKAPDLHAALQPVPAATADALTAAPVALHPFLAVHDGGWEIYDYVLCPCAQMTKHDAGLAIANHKFDEGDKLCLDLATAACIRSACAAPARGMCMRVCSAWHVHARVQRAACACACAAHGMCMCAPRRAPVGPGPLPACLGRCGGAASARWEAAERAVTFRPRPPRLSLLQCRLQATGALVHLNEDSTTAAVHGAAEAYLAEFREKVGKGELTYEDGWVEVTK
jgi:hypothetical protein